MDMWRMGQVPKHLLNPLGGKWECYYRSPSPWPFFSWGIPILVFCFCCNKLPQTSWLKTAHIYSLQFWRPEAWNLSHWAKAKISAGRFLLEAPGENPFPWIFQLLEMAHIPWLMALFLYLQSTFLQVLLLLCHLLLLLFILPPSFENPCDYTGSTWIVQDDFPSSRSLT